jgi:hypothetical protein
MWGPRPLKKKGGGGVPKELLSNKADWVAVWGLGFLPCPSPP